MVEALKIIAWKTMVKTVGRFSEGIRISNEYGFTSGKMLEYVYRQKPTGRFWIGQLVDRAFIGHVGWKAVCTRRRNIEALLEKSIADLRDEQGSVELLDIASGQGSYVISSLVKAGEGGISARCRDIDERWLCEGQENAKAAGLKNVIFEYGDALDEESFLATTPRPNLIVAVGFFDWLMDDESVKRTISRIYSLLKDNGRFVLTYQCAHPDLELVSKVFTHFDGKPLRMKLRAPSVFEPWLKESGFVSEKSLTDSNGFFQTVLVRKASRN